MRITKKQLNEMVRKAIQKSLSEQLGHRPSSSGMDEFTTSYMETALWSSTDFEDTPLDKNYSIDDFSEDAKNQMVKDCKNFQHLAGDVLYGREAEAGHDFWLTRNGHGSGFWDGDWEEPSPESVEGAAEEDLGDYLTEISNRFPEQELYVSDDNQIEIF